jgi:diguanylate cyclase (GGDEF)-like protein
MAVAFGLETGWKPRFGRLCNRRLSIINQAPAQSECEFMRSIVGWRFVVYIAVPLVMASLGAISLSYDLLRRVEAGSDAAELQRNKTVLTEAVTTLEKDLARLVVDNANWDEAFNNTAGQVDSVWFDRTWGNTLNVGQVYDTAAVLDPAMQSIVVGTSVGKRISQVEQILGDTPIAAFADMIGDASKRDGVVSGFVETADGPLAVAVARIARPGSALQGNGRLLLFGQTLKANWLGNLERRLLVGGLAIKAAGDATDSSLTLKGPDGRATFALVWKNRKLGQMVTGASWYKAAVVLGFLILVMTSIGFVSLRLVQQLAEDEGKAQHNAMHDHLTGLPNRAALTASMQALAEKGEDYAIAFADLDGFKEVNDSYGHEYGDRLIFMIGKGIRELATDATLCSRLGGDEFIILFSGAESADSAKTFAANLIAMLKQPFDMDGRLASVGASIGIAAYRGKEDVTEVLRQADIAMYKAKQSGKGRYCAFDQSFDEERIENLVIASELKSIIAARNLDIAFQPVVSAQTGEITGLEALARWPTTSARKVPADKFITVAESSGLIDDLGELILERACMEAVRWPGIRLAVNISAVQLNNPGFVKRSMATLAKYGVEPNRVEFEITETSLIHDTQRAKDVFKALQREGIKVALDDFGTGFSSIGYLRTFQFDRIKIDKSIVGKVLSSAAELAVVQGTLLVARGLSADVTAEGVETAEEASVLRLAGCTELQGYHYYKPMTAHNVTETLRKRQVAAVPRSVVVA